MAFLKFIGCALALICVPQWVFGLFPLPSPYLKLGVFPGFVIGYEAEMEKAVFAALQERLKDTPQEKLEPALEAMGFECSRYANVSSCGYKQPILPIFERNLIIGLKDPPESGIRMVNYGYTGP